MEKDILVVRSASREELIGMIRNLSTKIAIKDSILTTQANHLGTRVNKIAELNKQLTLAHKRISELQSEHSLLSAKYKTLKANHIAVCYGATPKHLVVNADVQAREAEIYAAPDLDIEKEKMPKQGKIDFGVRKHDNPWTKFKNYKSWQTAKIMRGNILNTIGGYAELPEFFKFCETTTKLTVRFQGFTGKPSCKLLLCCVPKTIYGDHVPFAQGVDFGKTMLILARLYSRNKSEK